MLVSDLLKEHLIKLLLFVIYEEKGYRYVIEMDGSSNRNSFKRIDAAGPDIYIVGRSGLFGLDEDIEKAWKMMSRDYEEMTGKNSIKHLTVC